MIFQLIRQILMQMINAIDYASVKKLALILWPGVDGELSKSTILRRLEELRSFTLATSEVDDKSSYFSTLKKIYAQIKDSRAGNTIPNAINILSQTGKGVLTKTLMSRKGYSKKEKMELDVTEELVRTTILLPLSGIMAINPFAQIKHKDLFELFVKTMDVYDQIEKTEPSNHSINTYKNQKRTDLHMQYLKLDKEGLWTSKDPNGTMTMQILVSPISFTQEESAHLLTGGFKNLEDGSIDIAFVSLSQFTDFQKEHNLDVDNIKAIHVNNYIVFWNKNNKNLELVVQEVNKLKERLMKLTMTPSERALSLPFFAHRNQPERINSPNNEPEQPQNPVRIN